MKTLARLASPALRARLLWLAAEWETYADRAQTRQERLAYRDAAEGLRRELAKLGSVDRGRRAR